MSRKFQCKTIPSKWLNDNGRRLDCGPYMSGAIEAKELLSKLPGTKEPLSNLVTGIYHAGRESRTWVETPKHGVPFMGSTDILAADLSHLPFISKKQVDANSNFKIGEGWTLITRSGTIGRMAYARSDMDGLACSEHVMRVVSDENKVKPGYVYAYLSSIFGVPLIICGTYGSIIQSIEPKHIADLPVPRLGQIEDQAHALVQNSADLLSKYQKKITEATNLFFKSVQMKDITAAEWHNWGADLGFTTTFKNAASLRSLNYNPRLQKLCDKIKQGTWKPLSQICVPKTLKSGPRFKRIDAEPEYGYQLIGQKQIFWLYPEGRWIAKKSVGAEVLAPNGAILVAAQGTLGEKELFCRAEFIQGNLTKRAYTQHFLRIIANEHEMKRGALFAFMRSETAFRMLRSISIGSKLQDFHPTMLANLPIPVPPEDVIHECNQLVIDAYNAREQAVQLEDQARSLVEKAIKAGGS